MCIYFRAFSLSNFYLNRASQPKRWCRLHFAFSCWVCLNEWVCMKFACRTSEATAFQLCHRAILWFEIFLRNLFRFDSDSTNLSFPWTNSLWQLENHCARDRKRWEYTGAGGDIYSQGEKAFGLTLKLIFLFNKTAIWYLFLEMLRSGMTNDTNNYIVFNLSIHSHTLGSHTKNVGSVGARKPYTISICLNLKTKS